MKVLILHHHFNIPQQGGAIRSYYLAKALVDRGIAVTVITTHNQPQEKTEIIEGIEVHYLPVAYDNNFGFYKRSISFLKYIHQSVGKLKTIGHIDLCYAISVPLTIGIAARWIKARYNIPYIFEVGDLWPDAPIQMGIVNNFFLKQALYDLEKNIYSQANSVVALSPMIQAEIRKKISSKSVHLLTNMADTLFYGPVQKDNSIEEKYNVSGKFVIAYIGAIGLANGLDYLLAFARVSKKASLPIQFMVCGEGAMKQRLQQTASKLQLDNVSFLPFTNRDGVKELMNVTDAAFICYKTYPVLETGSPNKYFDGLAAGKLIIINFGGWIKDEIESNACGIYVDPHKPEEFAAAIRPYLQGASLQKSQLASRKLAEEKYARKLLSEKFADMIQSAIVAS